MPGDPYDIVQHELALTCQTIQAELGFKPAHPQRLYYFASATELQAVIQSKSILARDWRLGCHTAVVAYGVDFVQTYLDTVPEGLTDPLRIEFHRVFSTNFHPRGTHFDGFVARLYEFDDAIEPILFPGYAIGFRVADLPIRTQPEQREMSIRLESTIDCSTEQLQIITILYQAYEEFFVSAILRFGDSYLDTILPLCWDKLRHHIGLYLMRFRDPATLQLREWSAIALTRDDKYDDSMTFEAIDNRLVPIMALPVTRAINLALPIGSVKIGAALPFETTKESLSAFLRHNGIFRVNIVRTQHFSGKIYE